MSDSVCMKQGSFSFKKKQMRKKCVKEGASMKRKIIAILVVFASANKLMAQTAGEGFTRLPLK